MRQVIKTGWTFVCNFAECWVNFFSDYFLYTSFSIGFGEVETMRPVHITPLLKWKFDLAFEEAGFKYVWEGYNRN